MSTPDLRHPPEAFPDEILRAVVGSTVNGLAVPGQHDLDLMGVRVEPVDAVLGLESFEQHLWRTRAEGEPSRPGDTELVVYGLRKFLRLVVSGNPTPTALLFVPSDHRHIDTALADELRALTPSIVSHANTGRAFLGYAEAQRQRLLGVRGGRSVRPRHQWIEGATFDTKYAMHMIRLLFQGIEVLEHGHLTLPMPEPERAYCYAIRVGEVELAEVLAKAEEHEARLRTLVESGHGPLRAEPELDAVNSFLCKTYLARYSTLKP